MSKYRIKKEAKFEAAHQIVGHQDPLKGGPGKCSRLHGHSYHIAVCVEAPVLMPIGFVVDFYWIGSVLKDLVDKWDHRNLNDLPDFEHLNTTAENIAGVVAHHVTEHIKVLIRAGHAPKGTRVVYGECRETESTYSRWYPED